MNYLTRQQQFVLAVIVCLLLLGWSVKAWRTAHPKPTPVTAPAQ